MTDSSDDSSDDGLLASPVFKKRDRRSERADRNKLDFLASCVAGSDARADVHRRIQEVDEEMRREEEEEENGGSESGKEGDDGEAEMEEGAAPGGDAATGEDNDGGAPKEEGKENGETNATALETAEAKSEEPSTIARKSSAATATATKTNKQREEDYWSRVDSFAGALKPPGTTVYDPHEARSKLEDGVSGLIDYSSDMTDDEGANWRDGAGGMTREQLRQEADARSRGMSSSLGLRPMFWPKSAVEREKENVSLKEEEKRSVMRAFQTTEEALTELKSVVSSLKRTHRTLGGPLLQPLNKVLRKPKGDVWDFLAKELCTNKMLKGRFAVRLPEEFCKWLWRMALSSVDAACTECQKLVRKYIVTEADVPNENSQPSFGVDMDFLQELGMLDLVSCLEDDFGLWLGDGPMPSPATKEARDENGDTPKEEDEAPVNMEAMRNVFLLWIVLLRRNLVRVQGNAGDSSCTIGDGASRAMVALTRVGLDPCIHSADENQKSAFEPLPRLLESLTTSLVRSATQQIRDQSGDVHVQQWTKRTARLMAEACIDLGAGAGEAADADDEDGVLPLATAVKQMICELVTEEDDTFSIEVVQMKLAFAARALRECLDEVTDWEGQVKERIDSLTGDWKEEEGPERSLARERLQYALHALVTAEVGFGHIDKEKQAFLNDHAHLLAAVNIAGECALIGLSIFHRTQNDDTSEESVYATGEKDAVYEVASNVEDLCDGIRKECRAVIAHPHLRRTKEYLTRLGKWLGGTKGKSSQAKKKKRQQGSLDCYFMSQGIGDFAGYVSISRLRRLSGCVSGYVASLPKIVERRDRTGLKRVPPR